MANLRRDTDEEKAFRKSQEEVQAVLDSTYNAALPDGTDYHVR